MKLRIIECGKDAQTRIRNYTSGSLGCQNETTAEAEGCFWDVVGDEFMKQTLNAMDQPGAETIYYGLIPRAGEAEGRFYSREMLRELIENHIRVNGHSCAIFDPYETEDDYGALVYRTYNWRRVMDKERGNTMDKKGHLPSFSEYKTNLKRSADRSTKKQAEGLYSAGAETLSKPEGLSPLSASSHNAINAAARSKALAYAHPVDSAIIKALDNPAINTVFNKVVQTSIDAQFGLALATGIHISPSIYPELYEIVVECAGKLGIPVPYVVISDVVHGINAMTAGTDQFSFIAISSMLPLVLKQNELKFVIGHECGHLAMGHVVYHTAMSTMGAAGGLLPVVGPIITNTIGYPLKAWSRRSEISADRAGLICCGDVQVAKRTLFRLEAGLINIDNVDVDTYVAESEQMLNSSAIGKLAEFNMQHPIIPKRIKALDYFAQSAKYAAMTGRVLSAGERLLSDEELLLRTEKIIEIM